MKPENEDGKEPPADESENENESDKQRPKIEKI